MQVSAFKTPDNCPIIIEVWHPSELSRASHLTSLSHIYIICKVIPSSGLLRINRDICLLHSANQGINSGNITQFLYTKCSVNVNGTMQKNIHLVNKLHLWSSFPKNVISTSSYATLTDLEKDSTMAVFQAGRKYSGFKEVCLESLLLRLSYGLLSPYLNYFPYHFSEGPCLIFLSSTSVFFFFLCFFFSSFFHFAFAKIL